MAVTASEVNMDTAPISPPCPSLCSCSEAKCRGQGQSELSVDKAKDYNFSPIRRATLASTPWEVAIKTAGLPRFLEMIAGAAHMLSAKLENADGPGCSEEINKSSESYEPLSVRWR